MAKPRQPDIEDLLDIKERMTRYFSHLDNLKQRRFTTGFGEIDGLIRGVAPGEVLTIIAYSGVFKSALLQNLLNRFALSSGLHQLFFSMEMPTEKVFEREIQMTARATGVEVEQVFADIDKARQYYNKAKEKGAGKVLVCDRTRLNIAEITQYLAIARQAYGEIGCIGIDYMGMMKAEGKTVFDKAAELSANIKTLAKEQNIPVILLGQVHRGYATSKGGEIETDAAKGGGDIEAGADFMLGMYRTENDDLIMKVLKNRNGPINDSFRIILDRWCLEFIRLEEYTPPKKQKVGKEIPF